MKKINIAIDGFSACGKSTTARMVARKLNYVFIDTGAMYRAVSLYLLRHGVSFEDEWPGLLRALNEVHLEFNLNAEGVPEIYLNGENVENEIRKMEVSAIVSEVSTLRSIRQAMVAQQQRMGENKGVVMDGRDIGTVVFPAAELKIFMTAGIEERIQRRMAELHAKGMKMTEIEIRENIEHRDLIDSTRVESPLRQASDAIALDNSNLSIEQQVDFVLKLAEKMIGE